MAFKFVPADWELSDELRAWTRNKGLSDETIKDALEDFRDHQFKVARERPDACWRNWVKKGIKWGNYATAMPKDYRRPTELTDEQRQADLKKWQDDMKRLRSVK